jgi:hypothetical protein
MRDHEAENQHYLRKRAFAQHVTAAIARVMDDYGECDPMEAVHDALVNLDDRIDMAGLADALDQYVTWKAEFGTSTAVA